MLNYEGLVLEATRSITHNILAKLEHTEQEKDFLIYLAHTRGRLKPVRAALTDQQIGMEYLVVGEEMVVWWQR